MDLLPHNGGFVHAKEMAQHIALRSRQFTVTPEYLLD